MENVELVSQPSKGAYDAIIVCVGHDQFREMKIEELRTFGRGISVIYDVKSIYEAGLSDGRL